MTPLQGKLIDLMKEVDQICRENNIVYYLHAGSALGAVRHRGFIPWDDDIDLIITQANWEKFYRAWHSKPRPDRALECIEDNPNHMYLFTRHVDTTTSYAFRWRAFNTGLQGSSIDFLIFDPVSDDIKLQKKYQKWMIAYGELLGRRLVVNPEGDLQLYRLLNFLGKFVGKKRVLKYVQKKMESYTVQDNPPCYMQRNSYSGYDWACSSRFLQKPTEIEMEGYLFYAPTYPEEFLRAVYGDNWLCLPPIEKRKIHPYVGGLNIPYLKAEQDAAKFVNIKKYDDCYVKRKPLSIRAALFERKRDRLDAIYRCTAYSLKLNKKLNTFNKNLEELLLNNQYTELYELFSDYYEEQLSEYSKLDVATNILTASYAEPFVISIPENALKIACMTLVLCGQYYNAQKILDMHFGLSGIRSDLLNPVQELINATRQLSIAQYDKKDWKTVEKIVEKWFPIYPHHIDFLYAKFRLMLMESHSKQSVENILKTVQDELTIHPQSAELTRIIADAQLYLDQKDLAINNYGLVLATSCNGIINLEVTDILSDLEITFSEDDLERIRSNCENQNLQIKVDSYQSIEQKTLILLQELDQICKSEDIPYFLSPALTQNALSNGKLGCHHYSNQVIMHPADREKFVQAFQKKYMTENRVLDCFETNPKYADFTIHYCDTHSLIFHMESGGLYQYYSVCIEILFVRPKEKNKIRQKFNTGIMAAIEGAAFPSPFHNLHAKKVFAGVCARCMMLVFGKQNTKKICWNWIFNPINKSKIINGKIKSYWTKYTVLPELDFEKKCIVYLNNIPFPIPQNYELYRMAVRKNPAGPNTVNLKNSKRYITMPDIYSSQYIEKIKPLFKMRSKYTCKMDRLFDKGQKYSGYVVSSWNLVYRNIVRLQMINKYMPLKPTILKLYQEKNYVELANLLDEYIQNFKALSRKRLALVFDSDIFRIVWDLLEKNGEEQIVERVLSKIPLVHLKSELYEERKRDHLKLVATEDTLKRILEYLEPDVVNCLYLYIDLSIYGLKNPNINVWYQEDEEGIYMVVMQYHQSFQVYASRNYDCIDGILRLVEKRNPYAISGRSEIIHALSGKLDQYKAEFGVVTKHRFSDTEKLERILDQCDVQIEQATTKDAREIAELICSDPELGAPYTVDSLSKELVERMETGMGRSLIIRKNGKIVGHTATFAEYGSIAMGSGLIIAPAFRDTMYFNWLDSYMELTLKKEGKNIYGMVLDPRLLKAYKRSGSDVVAEYGKLSLIKK